MLDPFRRWAKADRRFADPALDEIAVVTLPQPIIVAALRQGGLKLGNAIIDISTKSRFYPDIVMGGAEPLRELRGAGLVRAEARVFARHAGLALLVRAGNPLAIASHDDLLRPEVTIVIASASEPGARPVSARPERSDGRERCRGPVRPRDGEIRGPVGNPASRRSRGVGEDLRQRRHHLQPPGAILCAHVSHSGRGDRCSPGRSIFPRRPRSPRRRLPSGPARPLRSKSSSWASHAASIHATVSPPWPRKGSVRRCISTPTTRGRAAPLGLIDLIPVEARVIGTPLPS